MSRPPGLPSPAPKCPQTPHYHSPSGKELGMHKHSPSSRPRTQAVSSRCVMSPSVDLISYFTRGDKLTRVSDTATTTQQPTSHQSSSQQPITQQSTAQQPTVQQPFPQPPTQPFNPYPLSPQASITEVFNPHPPNAPQQTTQPGTFLLLNPPIPAQIADVHTASDVRTTKASRANGAHATAAT
jgi:hypothetical protein